MKCCSPNTARPLESISSTWRKRSRSSIKGSHSTQPEFRNRRMVTMRHGNINAEILHLRRALALPFTPAEEAQQAICDAAALRDGKSETAESPLTLEPATPTAVAAPL